MKKLQISTIATLLLFTIIATSGCSVKATVAIDMNPIYSKMAALDRKNYTPFQLAGKDVSEDSFTYETELLRQIFEQSNIKFINKDEGRLLAGTKVDKNDINVLTWNCDDVNVNQGKEIAYIVRIF